VRSRWLRSKRHSAGLHHRGRLSHDHSGAELSRADCSAPLKTGPHRVLTREASIAPRVGGGAVGGRDILGAITNCIAQTEQDLVEC